MSEIEFVEKDKKTGRTTFLLKNSTPAIANALRRAMMDSVPTMAIEEVEFRKNNSVLYDEIIAQRLGLVPLTTDLKGYDLPSKCKCNGTGCASCTLKLTLKAKGPGTVYASDLKSKDPAVKPVYPELQIAKLLKGQELEVEATAVLGRGKDHTKWSPCLAWYIYRPKVTVNNEHPKFEELKDKYPPQVFKDGKINKKLIEEKNLYDAVEGISDVVQVEYDPTSFLFYLEPWGQLSSKEIMVQALEIISSQLKELEEKLEK